MSEKAAETAKTQVEAQVAENKPDIVDLTDSTPKRTDLKFYTVFGFTHRTKDGQVHQGTFVVKRLTIGDQSRLGVRVAQLEGGLSNVEGYLHFMNEMIALCEIGLVEKPAWFEPTEMFDVSLLGAVYAEVRKFNDSFR